MRLLKYKDREIVVPRVAMGLGGEYRFEIRRENGDCEFVTDWFSNNITDSGMDFMATSTTRYSAAQVGTGTATPTNTDTTLQSFTAGTSVRSQLGETLQVSVSPYYQESYFRYDFATGAVVGNVSEVGVGPSAASGETLFSRELIRDVDGDPTTITVLVTEALRVHYRIRTYMPMDDVPGSVNIAGVDYATTRRVRAGFSDLEPWRMNVGATAVRVGVFSALTYTPRMHTGAMVGITAAADPSGTSFSDSISVPAYSAGSFTRTMTATWGLTKANGTNLSTVFHAGHYNQAGGGFDGMLAKFQVGLSPGIVKTSSEVLTLEYRVSWARYVP